MKTLLSSLEKFVRDEDAPTTMEYGLMAFLIAVLAIGAVTLIGSNTISLYAVNF